MAWFFYSFYLSQLIDLFNLISIAVIVLNYLALIKLQLKKKNQSIIGNFPAPFELVIRQIHDQVRMTIILQLISGISRVPKSYLSTLMVLLFQYLPLAGVFLAILILVLNYLEFTIVAVGPFM